MRRSVKPGYSRFDLSDVACGLISRSSNIDGSCDTNYFFFLRVGTGVTAASVINDYVQSFEIEFALLSQ